jgi:hypothetical protein
VRLAISDGTVYHPGALLAARREILAGYAPVERTERNSDLVAYFFNISALPRPEALDVAHRLGSRLMTRLFGLAYHVELDRSPWEATAPTVASKTPTLRIVAPSNDYEDPA